MPQTTHCASVTAAGIPVRIAARVIDVLILVVIDGALGRAIGFGFDWLFMAAAIVITYFVVLDVFAGTTAGKAVFGLHVTAADGRRLSAKQALIRESFILLGAVPFAGPLLAAAGWVWILLTMRSSPLRQGKHDQLAGGTLVVHG
ncbi:MAG TPA: RDD family protein [Candidatus Acidoferrales bacterium]|nr:RDD family protein [Candidatus Acidoferrales bacterium]